MKRRTLAVLALSLIAPLIAPLALANKAELTVAIALDIPPYVMENAAEGLEVEIVRRALADYSVQFVPMPNSEVDTAVQQGLADVAVTVLGFDDSVFYSNDYIAFANTTISKQTDGLGINSIADLKNHRVLAWQGAYSDLGGEFEQLFAPGAPQHENYVEFANQEDQVRTFWQGEGSVAVIDRSIFRYFSEAMGHSMSEVDLHSMFPPVTDFKVGFKDAAVRDSFNQGLAELCQSGEYAALLDRYSVVLDKSICDQ
jgi:polar amino acid transport system substrate-binding protein